MILGYVMLHVNRLLNHYRHLFYTSDMCAPHGLICFAAGKATCDSWLLSTSPPALDSLPLTQVIFVCRTSHILAREM